jgi:hypothetical protein
MEFSNAFIISEAATYFVTTNPFSLVSRPDRFYRDLGDPQLLRGQGFSLTLNPVETCQVFTRRLSPNSTPATSPESPHPKDRTSSRRRYKKLHLISLNGNLLTKSCGVIGMMIPFASLYNKTLWLQMNR